MGISWAFVGGNDIDIDEHQLGVCRQQRRQCWWASTALEEPTWVGIDVAVGSTHISRWGGACDVVGLVRPNDMQTVLVYKHVMNYWPKTWFLERLRLGEAREGQEGGSEDEGWTLSHNVGCQSCHVSHKLKITQKLMYESNNLHFEMEIFWPKTYQILRLKNWLRPLRLVFSRSSIFKNGDGPKTGPQLWSRSVLRISGLDRSWSGLVSVFFQS